MRSAVTGLLAAAIWSIPVWCQANAPSGMISRSIKAIGYPVGGGSTTVDLKLVNSNTQALGNDFAVDDVYLGVPLRRQVPSRLVAMDSRDHEQRRPRLLSPDVVDSQFLPGFREIRLRLGLREHRALFGCQIMEPEAKNKERSNG